MLMKLTPGIRTTRFALDTHLLLPFQKIVSSVSIVRFGSNVTSKEIYRETVRKKGRKKERRRFNANVRVLS